MDGCADQYNCVCNTYLLTYLALEFCIIIDRQFGSPGNGKYVVHRINARDKQMFKL